MIELFKLLISLQPEGTQQTISQKQYKKHQKSSKDVELESNPTFHQILGKIPSLPGSSARCTRSVPPLPPDRRQTGRGQAERRKRRRRSEGARWGRTMATDEKFWCVLVLN